MEHEKYIEIAEKYEKNGMLNDIVPNVISIKYVGHDVGCFYLFATNNSNKYFLCIGTILTSSVKYAIPVLFFEERNDMIIVNCINENEEIFFASRNMSVSGIKFFHMDIVTSIDYIGNGKIIGELCLVKNDTIDLFTIKLHDKGYKLRINRGLEEGIINDFKQNLHVKFLEVFKNNLNLIDRCPSFQSFFTQKLLNMLNMLVFSMNEYGYQFNDKDIKRDIYDIILWNECERVKCVVDVLFEESCRMKFVSKCLLADDETLPSLVMRAMVYENSLLLYRKMKQQNKN